MSDPSSLASTISSLSPPRLHLAVVGFPLISPHFLVSTPVIALAVVGVNVIAATIVHIVVGVTAISVVVGVTAIPVLLGSE